MSAARQPEVPVRLEFNGHGINSPICDSTDAIPFCDVLHVSGRGPLVAENGATMSWHVPARRSQTCSAFSGDARPASTLIGVSALAIPGMKVDIEAIVGTPL